MTEVKWGILFTGVFLCMMLGMEFQMAFLEQISYSELNLNMQLDTCLEDTLEYTEFVESEVLHFVNVEKTEMLLWENLCKALGVSENHTVMLKKAVAFVCLYEEGGFYYRGNDETGWEWQNYEGKNLELRIKQMEKLMEKETGEVFTFPKIKEETFANSLDGTGILLFFKAPQQKFLGQNYNRLILSGAKVEKMW